MATSQTTDQQKREAETARQREREGHGTVPNVDPNNPDEPLAEAFHQLEEDKGDWSKGGG